MHGAVDLPIELLKQQKLKPALLHEFQVQLVEKDFGSKSTYLNKSMPKGSKLEIPSVQPGFEKNIYNQCNLGLSKVRFYSRKLS